MNNIKEIISNDYVIVRNDGIVMRNKIGDYRLFSSIDGNDLKNAINDLHSFANKIKAPYTFKAVKYKDLPDNNKY